VLWNLCNAKDHRRTVAVQVRYIKSMEAIEAYEGLVQIIDTGSLSDAARALGVPRPTLSRRLAALEEALGVRLLHRGNRGALPTRAGERLYARVRPLVEALRDAEREVQQMDDLPRGLLRVSVSPAVAELFAPMLDAYARACPEVRVEVLSSNRFVDLKAEQFDVAIRGGALRDSDLISRALVRTEAFPVASPAYLGQHGHPTSADELASHRCLLGYGQRERPETRWPLRQGGWVPVSGPLTTNDRGLLRHSALEGHGIALLSAIFVKEALATGRLVPVLRDQVGGPLGLYAVYPERSFTPPQVRVFVEHAVGFFAGLAAVG